MAQNIWGELVVIALKAEDLKHQARGVQNPFCVFRVGESVQKTQIDKGGGLNPIWDDQVNMTVSAGQHQLYVQVFNNDTNPANLMADGVIELAKVFREREHDGFFQMLHRGRPTSGKIYLELTFYPSQNNVARQPVRHQQPMNYPPMGFRPPNNQRPPPHMAQGYPQPQYVPNVRPSSSMGTSRYPTMPVSQPMPPPHQQQPLLSAPYNPGQRPPPPQPMHNQVPRPHPQGQRPPPPGHYPSNRPPPSRPIYQNPVPPAGYQRPVNYRPNYH